MEGGPHKDRVAAQGCECYQSTVHPLNTNKLKVVELDSRKHDCPL